MKKSFAPPLLALVTTGLLLVGCKKDDATAPTNSDPSGVTNEQTAMQYSASTDPFVQNDEETFADKDVEAMDYGTFGKIDASIIPVRFGRFITNVTRTYVLTVLPGDSIALMDVQKDINGNFAILAKYLPTDTGFTLIQKPFHDHATRTVAFKRVSRHGLFVGRWVPVATSLVDGATVPPAGNPATNVVHLSMVQVFTATDTVTVTNPDTTFLRYRWTNLFARGHKNVPEFLGGEPIRLQATVVSTSPDTDLVALRFGFGGMQRRRVHMTMITETNNGNGTYTRVFETDRTVNRMPHMHFFRGWFHLGIDAATRGTIYDDQTPYNVSWWGIPYRVF
jgi:hypothetical protein